MPGDEMSVHIELEPPVGKQCPVCKFYTEPLPNGLVPEHGLPYGTNQMCPGETIFRPKLVKKPKGEP